MIWADYGITDATMQESDGNLVNIFILVNPSARNPATPIFHTREQVVDYLKSGKSIVTIKGTHEDWTLMEKIILYPLGKIIVEGKNPDNDNLGEMPVFYKGEE